MSESVGIVWFRRDLRLRDNPAWAQATIDHDNVLAVFVLEPSLLNQTGAHRRSQLLAHLDALNETLTDLGGMLVIRQGPATDAIPRLIDEVDAADLYLNNDYSRFAQRRDDVVREQLHPGGETTGPGFHGFHGNVVHVPGTVLTTKGTLSQVFSPFHKRWDTTPLPHMPEARSEGVTVLTAASEALPSTDTALFQPGGEEAAWDRVEQWLTNVDDYPDTRNIPAIDGTSQLSADLRLGVLSPRSVLEAVGSTTKGRAAFVRQLAWRDWWAHTLAENQDLPYRAVRPEYDQIDWSNDAEEFAAWQAGQTGYPLVDAGMRQLAETGWMHNRVRMVCASFLVKDLLIDWRWGERHFRELLVDGEPSQNAGNWQWAAGTGPDAAPYFRIFNPTTQSEKFDPDGVYIRRWVPELAPLDSKAIHEPSKVGPLDLAAAGITLGDDYPYPIVDHSQARERTLAAYKQALSSDSAD